MQASAELAAEIKRRRQLGHSGREVAKALGISKSTVDKYTHRAPAVLTSAGVVPADQPTKKIGEFDWREACSVAKGMQALKSKSSWTQDYANIVLGDGGPVILMAFGDQHIGAYGCNLTEFERITDEIVNTPNLYVALLGDETEMAIKLRNVLEVTSQVFTPEMQEAFLESWLEEIRARVAFAVWGNHAICRGEAQAGTSGIKRILSRGVIYHNGIAHQDIAVGSQVYKCAASHLFRGNSMFNRMHSQGRYVRQEAADRELVMSGHIHSWGFAHTEDGGRERVYLTSGSLQENNGYSKRFFSLKTAPYFPCVVLMPDEHQMIPFKRIRDALRFVNGGEA